MFKITFFGIFTRWAVFVVQFVIAQWVNECSKFWQIFQTHTRLDVNILRLKMMELLVPKFRIQVVLVLICLNRLI